jgi:predicted anti-sigma-YlaC factor YlaD
MLTCQNTSRLLSERLERRLTWLERLVVAVHLLGCRPCRRFRRALGWLHRSLASAPVDVRMPRDARERVRRALEVAARE